MGNNKQVRQAKQAKAEEEKKAETAQTADNPIVDTIENLKRENAELKNQVAQLQYRVEILLTRINRIESFQTEMDVYLRNHQHQNQNLFSESSKSRGG
jgi:FtsZ-binding cell division protein ZapB